MQAGVQTVRALPAGRNQARSDLLHQGHKGSPNFGPAVWSPIDLLHLGALRDSLQKFIERLSLTRLCGEIRLLYESNAAASIRHPLDRLAGSQLGLRRQF